VRLTIIRYHTTLSRASENWTDFRTHRHNEFSWQNRDFWNLLNTTEDYLVRFLLID
jgi:hypothetical protein